MQKIVLKEVVDYLHKVYPNASIGVGGSVALGTYGVDSDVDIIFQREDCRKSFLLSFYSNGIKVSIFSFSKKLFLENERKYLLAFNSMPITFISSVSVLYDDYGLIVELKEIVRNLVERCKVLRYIFIDELKREISEQLQLDLFSILELKIRVYTIVSRIICLFYLKFHAGRIVPKQERCNPYLVIKRDDYILYEKLKECLPYDSNSYNCVRDLFENYIQKKY